MSSPPTPTSPRVSVELPTLESVHEARKRIAPHVLRTPLVRLNTTSNRDDENGGEAADQTPEIYLKLENLQHTGCFKARGAFNALLSASKGESLKNGVVTASAGNFGQGLAWCAMNLRISCTVVVPDSAPQTKLAALKSYNAEVVKVTYDQWWATMEARRAVGYEHKLFIHPCSENEVFSGNGTIALEILEDLPDVDAVIVPFGGGGMCVGVGSVMKEMRPQCKVFPVEVETAAPLRAAYAAGSPTKCPYTRSFVDGIGASTVLREMWPLVKSVSEEPLCVSLEDVARAVHTMVKANHVVAEGAGAAPVAAGRNGLAGSGKVVAVVSGGNIDVDALAVILQGEIPTPAGREADKDT